MAKTENNKALYVKCPFFGTVSGRWMTCEGVVDGSTIVFLFDTKHLMEAYMNENCNTLEYAGCWIYQAILKKYEVDKR